PVPAPPPAPRPAGGEGSPMGMESLTLPADRQVQRRIEAAAEYLKARSWADATRLLQTVLDAPEDASVPVPRPGRLGPRWGSARRRRGGAVGRADGSPPGPAPGDRAPGGAIHTGRRLAVVPRRRPAPGADRRRPALPGAALAGGDRRGGGDAPPAPPGGRPPG